jgi:hypothetical protein
MVHPDKTNDTVTALPMRDNSSAHSGENCEETVRKNGVIRVFNSSIHRISVK